jgi:hypothetical protein
VCVDRAVGYFDLLQDARLETSIKILLARAPAGIDVGKTALAAAFPD